MSIFTGYCVLTLFRSCLIWFLTKTQLYIVYLISIRIEVIVSGVLLFGLNTSKFFILFDVIEVH